MITRFYEDDLKGTIKIVPHNEVEDLTAGGWKLVAMLTTQEARTLVAEMPNPALANEPYHSQQTVPCAQAMQAVTIPLFMMQHTDAVDALIEMKDKLKNTQNLLGSSTKRNSELDAEVVRLTAGIDSCNAGIEQYQDTARELRKQHKAVKTDLAKVRAHFGEKSMAEALGTA